MQAVNDCRSREAGIIKKLSAALALSLTACSPSAGIPASGVVGIGAGKFEPPSSKANLFVENHDEVVEYTRRGRLVRTISLNTSGTDAGGLAFDNSGYLYAISGYFGVALFAPGSRSFVRTITDGVFEPLAIAVDRSGNLYVANGHNGYEGNIAVYSPGSGTPSRTITEDIYDPESLAFDSAGNLYVGNGLYADEVTVYSPSGTLLRTITDGVRDPQSIALDARDDLFVANTEDGEGRTVTVYAPGKTQLLQTITDGIDCPQTLAVDSAGRLYVANNANGTATVYTAKTRKLLRTISKKVRNPWGLAVDSADTLYLASFLPTARIGIYPPGHLLPVHTIGSFALTLVIGPP
jgi:DNA-binding beta-propeller fold protein YncE